MNIGEKYLRNCMVIFGLLSALTFGSCQYVTEKFDEQFSGILDSDNKTAHASDSLNTSAIVTKSDSVIQYEMPPEYPVDKDKNDFANFVAGIEVKHGYTALQQKGFYSIHSELIEREWDKTETKRLTPIRSWMSSNHLTNANDTNTVFYPFSGPDFVYPYAFFPHSKNYILIGLEKLGTIPDLASLEDTILSQYLQRFRYSLRYINKVGYFTTNQMRNDFAQSSLNGVIHVLLFYLARTKHQIVAVEYFYLDKNGKQVLVTLDEANKKPVRGLCIKAFDQTANVLKNVYYLPFDLSNQHCNTFPEFNAFLAQFGKKNTYIKSGSYILHDANFTQIRDVILSQSVKVLQDDSGIPFNKFDKNRFNVRLFGDYTRTISDFRLHYQPEMKAELDRQSQKYNTDLNFLLGYNASHNETLMLFAQLQSDSLVDLGQPAIAHQTNEIKEEPPVKVEGGRVVYKVQIKTSSKKLAISDKVFAGLPDVDFYLTDGVYKYTIGKENEMHACQNLQKLAKSKGFNDSFIIAFYNNKRISLDDAKRMKSTN